MRLTVLMAFIFLVAMAGVAIVNGFKIARERQAQQMACINEGGVPHYVPQQNETICLFDTQGYIDVP